MHSSGPPSLHSGSGVRQYQTRFQKPGSSAWYSLQKFGFSVSSQAFSWAGASPNHSATSAFTFGLMIQFIHSYMQLGCLALELIIQVSDQPVAPSLGRKPWLAGLASTGTPSSFSRKYWYCQVVPRWTSPAPKAWTCLASSPQYSPTLACCSFSR